MSKTDEKFLFKTGEDIDWQPDSMFYVLTADGLMICRNHEWFTSCAPAQEGPYDLKPQEPFMRLRYPKVPKALFEQVVGFFEWICHKWDTEVAVLTVWNTNTKAVEIVVPSQHVSFASVDYKVPELPPHLRLIGSIHSHVNMSAFASSTDTDDETHRPGVHIVVGRLKDKVPEFHVEVVVDGYRFKAKLDSVCEGFDVPQNFPNEWKGNVKKKKFKSWAQKYFPYHHSGGHFSGGHYSGGHYPGNRGELSGREFDE